MDGKSSNYIKIAEQDYKAACELYDAELFPQALYSFQQAVEKLCKYVAIRSLLMSEIDIKHKIGHKMLYVFKLMFAKIKETTPFIVNTLNETDFNELEKTVHVGTESQFVSRVWENIVCIGQSPWPIDMLKYDSEFDALVGYFENMGIDIYQGNPPGETEKKFIEVGLKNETSRHIININLGAKLLPLLLFMTIYMSRYKSDEFRYPSERIGNPTDYFNGQKEYVKKLPHLCKLYSGLLEFIIHIEW